MHREELHEREQYFFDAPTRDGLCRLLAGFERPCCLCAPTVAEAMCESAGRREPRRDVRLLDIDSRFAHLPGYVEWNIRRPRARDERFDLILCDPPFFTVSLSELFGALRLLARFDLSQPLLISYLTRRAHAIESVFAPFGLRATGVRAGYLTVQRSERNDIQWFANFDLCFPPQ